MSIADRRFRWLQEDRNIDGLLRELHCRQDPEHRKMAMQALNALHDAKAISGLLQSAMNEPDAELKGMVRQILKEWLAGDFELALRVEASGGSTEGPWLSDCLWEAFAPEPDAEDLFTLANDHQAEDALAPGDKNRSGAQNDQARFQWLQKAQNLDALVHELSCKREPGHRMKAAQALGELHEPEVIPWLLQAALYDPDEEVRATVHKILKEWLSVDYEAALKIEASGGPPEEPHMNECLWRRIEPGYMAERRERYDEDVQGDSGAEWADAETAGVAVLEDGNWYGLMLVAQTETDPVIRAKAIRRLGQISDVRALDVLAEIVLKDTDEKAAATAYQVLENRFGEDVNDYLENYRNQTGETDEEEAEENETGSPTPAHVFTESPQPSTVIQEDRGTLRFWLGLAVIVLLAVVAVIKILGQ